MKSQRSLCLASTFSVSHSLHLTFALWSFPRDGHKPGCQVATLGLCGLGACRLECLGWMLGTLEPHFQPVCRQPSLGGSGSCIWKNLKHAFMWDKHSGQKTRRKNRRAWLLCFRWTDAFPGEPWHQLRGLAAAGNLRHPFPLGPTLCQPVCLF